MIQAIGHVRVQSLRLHRLAFVCVLVSLALVGSVVDAADNSGRDARVAALRKLEAAVSGRELHGDAIFLLAQGAHAAGRKPVLPALLRAIVESRDQFPHSLEYKFWSLRDVQFPVVPVPLPAVSAVTRPHNAGSENEIIDDARAQAEWVLLVMANAIQCSGPVAVTDLIGQPNNDYIVTHQVFALLLGAQRGCIAQEDLERLLPQYVARVRDEFLAHGAGLTDLQIERAAMLCMVGRCDVVPPSFLASLVRAQGKDGLWRLDDPLVRHGMMPPEHSSALAYYVLARSLK